MCLLGSNGALILNTQKSAETISDETGEAEQVCQWSTCLMKRKLII